MVNVEAAYPPVYYSIAGAWWQFGKLLGLGGGYLLYWLRYLNIPLLLTAIWLGWLATKMLFPENIFVRLAVPAFIAFMPQSTFYAINNDIMSPVTFGAAFILLMRFWMTETPSVRLATGLGMALAATFLNKISNLPLLGVTGILLITKFLFVLKRNAVEKLIKPYLILAACSILPAGIWGLWCKIHFGDFSGKSQKIQHLGWTAKPFSEWFNHPIFQISGVWKFLSGNLATFWQGEIIWHGRPLSLPLANFMYASITLGLLMAVLITLTRKPAIYQPAQRQILWLSFGFCGAFFLFYAILSVKYDFHDCYYPSRTEPYFTSGRLMLGMLVPFLMLIATGLDRLLITLSMNARFSVLGLILSAMVTTELATNWQIFSNEYNWFHM